MATTENLWTAF